MKICWLQHVPFEGLGYIGEWIGQKGYPSFCIRVFAGEKLPGMDQFDWLIVMGGPMGIHDDEEHPWLPQEREFIKEAVENGKTVLGICLGSQFVAEALGGKVYPGPEKEIGWFPVEKTPDGKNAPLLSQMPDSMKVFHWHGDTFDLPPGIPTLLKSELIPNQAFIYNERVAGLQFHFEANDRSVKDIVANSQEELAAAGGRHVQTSGQMYEGLAYAKENNRIMASILDYLDAQTGA